MADPQLGQLVASVLEKVVGDKPTDNVFTSQALLNLLKSGNGFRSLSGGRVIEETLEYAENTTFKSYSDLETLDTTRVDVFDCARFEWKEIGGTVVISELEKARAQGAEAKFELASAKVNNAKNSMMAVLNRQMYAAGTANGGKDIGGLALLVASTATSGTVGGIDRAAFPFWRNRSNSAAKTTNVYDNLRKTMALTYNECSKGAASEHPEMFLMNMTDFGGYEALLTANERFTSKSEGDGGFKNEVLKFKGAKVTFDEDCPAATAFCLNSRNLKFNYPSGRWMKVFPSVTPANQTAEITKLLVIGNMSINNPRRLGVLTATTS